MSKEQNNETLDKELKAVKEELSRCKKELETTRLSLKIARSHVMKSEKMALLGQLVAGIAHELNTPLGAIKSSIESVQDTSNKSLDLLPELIKKLSEEQFALFTEMLKKGINNTSHTTSREERKIRRQTRKYLEEQGIKTGDEIADILTDMGVYDGIDKFISLFEDKNVELIMKTGYNIAVQHKNSKNIKTAINRAAKIILALKTYSHSGDYSEKIITDINSSIETVLTVYHNKLKYNFTIEKQFGKIPEINAFPDKLTQVWTNIIHNAIQAMVDKGTLTIKTYTEKDNVVASFSDTGNGIPDEIKDKIFAPFFTTKAVGEGSGLGLDIIKKIIEKHNGSITFETEKGKGTTFFVKLPVSRHI